MMKIGTILLCSAFGALSLQAASHQAWTLTSEVFASAKPAKTDHSPKAMVEAAKAFLATLSEDERKLALLPLNHPERKLWTNVPASADDGGLRLGDLSKPQLESACAFLSTVMSTSGYLKSRNIMLADDLLLRSKKQAERRGGLGAANYWIAIFGEPSETETWGVQWDGHHVAVNLTIKGKQMSLSPSFIGTQPHQFMLGDEEIVPMAQEGPLAHEFLNSLDEKQRASAVLGETRGRMKAGAGRDGVKPKPEGVSCATLTGEQKKILMKLVALWVSDLPEAPAKARMKEIEAQLDKTYFSWYGPQGERADASYHFYGPELIIEYNGQDLGGDPLDHLHSIYRNPKNEYGELWTQGK